MSAAQPAGVRDAVSDQLASDGRKPLTTAELRRRLRQTGGRGRKLRGLPCCCGPTAARVILMFVALLAATAAALAPPPLVKFAIDDGIKRRRPRHAEPRRRRCSSLSALVYWGATYAQTYLVGWVGQRALQDLRLRIFAHLQSHAGRLLRAPPGRPAHLAHDQRRAGARLARHRQRRDAVSEHADAARHDGDPAVCSTSSSRC